MDENNMKSFYELAKPFMNEKSRRHFVASVALTYGRGGISAMNRATGIAREVIRNGINELTEDFQHSSTGNETEVRIRKQGAGRKKAHVKDQNLACDLITLVEPVTRGDPESSLLWTSKSVRNLTDELNTMGHSVSRETVRLLLKEMGYSLQANYKNIEKNQHEDRNEQFEYIYKIMKETQSRNQPVISVDTKKRELIGNYKNNGKEWRPEGQPLGVNVHDFEDKELGHAIPFGVYDITENQGWVSVGITHDTSRFAVSSIRNWWNEMGKDVYPKAVDLMITADSGGSNGCRRRLWKAELQHFADETGLILHILHFPPGTSKWNKIEHRMFSFISKNWRGRPLTSLEVIVSLISNTTTKSGLSIKCAVDNSIYQTGVKVTDEEMESLNLTPDTFHGGWNYRIAPRGNNMA